MLSLDTVGRKNIEKSNRETNSVVYKHILIIEPEHEIVNALAGYLKAGGFALTILQTGNSVVPAIKFRQPDCILLDLDLPDLDGFEVCRRIRAISDVPIVIVTAANTEEDRLLALEIGADGYVAKPFSPRELMARIRVMLRRWDKQNHKVHSVVPAPKTDQLINLGRLVINMATWEVWYDQQPVPLLTNRELKILLSLANHPGRVYTIAELVDTLSGDDDMPITSRTLYTHISNLRNKLPNPNLVKTVFGFGYKLLKDEL